MFRWGDTVTEIDDIIDGYAASLIEPDENLRRAILERVWADDCEVVLPEVRLVGRAEINVHITRIHHSFGHATPILTGSHDAHSGFVRFEWRVIAPAGEIVAADVSAGEHAADGRLRRAVLFRGVRPDQYI